MKFGIAMMLTALLSAALFAIPSKVAIAQKASQNQTMLPANATKSTSVLIPINLGQLRDQIRSQHPLLAAIADKIQTLDAKDTLKYTIGVDIVSDMLKAHARQLLLLGKAISNQTSGNQTSGNQTK